MRVSGGGCCQRRRAKTGGTGTFSTFKLCLLSGSPGEIYRADGGCVGADGTGYFNHGRTGIGSRRSQSAPLAGILSEASWKKNEQIACMDAAPCQTWSRGGSANGKTDAGKRKYPVRSYKTEKLKSENPASKKEEIEKREVCDTKASEQRTVSVVGGISQQLYEKILMQAVQRKMELEAQGKQVTLVREEPFTTAQDSVEYNVYLMIWKKKRGNRIVEVERFSG